MSTYVPHTHLITFLGVDKVVVLEQRGTNDTVKNKPHIRILPAVLSLAASLMPHSLLGGTAAKEEAKILFSETKGQTPIFSP